MTATSTPKKFRCSYDLDDRIDKDLVTLNQSMYRFLQTAFGKNYHLPLESDGLPNAVAYYLLYTAALIYGAADAALTLTLHNLGREARLLERQVFECWVRAVHYVDHPDLAKQALIATPFRERELLDELGYTKDSERYTELNEFCSQLSEKYPDAGKYREPTVARLLEPKQNQTLARMYALHYRVASQMAHATFAGVGGVIGEAGVSFDSRELLPNFGIEQCTVVLLEFLELIEKQLSLGITTKIDAFRTALKSLQERLRFVDS